MKSCDNFLDSLRVNVNINMANYYSDSNARFACCMTVLRMTLNGQDLVTKVILPDWPIDLLESLAMMTSLENLYFLRVNV